MIVYVKTISVNYYSTLRQLIRLLILKRSIKPYLWIFRLGRKYYNNLCLQLEETCDEQPRGYFDATAICTTELPPTEPATLRDIVIHHIHSNLAVTIRINERATFWNFAPQKTIIPKLPLPLSIQAELLVLHDHCDLHGHRRYERSNTFSRGLIYIGGNSPLAMLLKELGKPGEKMLSRYFRVPDFGYELMRLVPFRMPTGPEVPSRDFIEIVKPSILFSKRLGWLLY